MTANSETMSVLRHAAAQSCKPDFALHKTQNVWLMALLPGMIIVAMAAFQPWIDPADLFRDPLAVAELKGLACCKVYDGAMSNLGVILWMACATVCIFAAGIVTAGRENRGAFASFLLAGGLFTAFLGFDDLFLVHENVLPALGVPEPVTYGAYAVIAMSYLAMSWRIILQNRFILLGAGIALLATSVVIDRILHFDNVWRLITEDGAKFVGIWVWTAFHVDAAWHGILRTRD